MVDHAVFDFPAYGCRQAGLLCIVRTVLGVHEVLFDDGADKEQIQID